MAGIWHPFTQQRGFEPLGEVVRAEGSWLHLANGHKVLDGISSWWVNLHGHAHPRLAKAIADQAACFDQVILADLAHGPARELSEALADRLPNPIEHVFFTDDGSTAVEVAVKMAWQAQRTREPRRHRLLALDGGYHGDTLGAMSLASQGPYHTAFKDLLLQVDTVPFDDGDAAEAYVREHGDTLVAAIVEPMVQCAGGMRVGEPASLRRLADAVQGAGALLIADEVAVGFGRTGRMWGFEHAGVTPDLVCMSKGITGGTLPLGATAATQAIYDSFLGDDKRSAFLHGHSYGGNPIACAVALESLRVLDEEQTVARLARIAPVWRDAGLEVLPRVTNVRGLGSIVAFDIEGGDGYHDPIGRQIQRRAWDRGLYLRPLGDVVYLMPPASITDGELAWAIQVIKDVFAGL